jgi:hypothetical protein
MRRSRFIQSLNESCSEIGITGGAYPFANIHYKGERPHEVRDVPPRLFARCGLALGKGASLDGEAVLADLGRESDIAARVGG